MQAITQALVLDMAQTEERPGESCPDEAHLRIALRAGCIGVWNLDLGTGQMGVSAEFRRHFGFDPDAALTLTELESRVHPDDRARLAAAMEQCLAGSDYDIEFRSLQPPQSLVWIHLKAQVIRSTQDGALRLVGVSMDVTPRHAAEDALRQSSILLRAVLETAPGLIYAKDIDGRMLIANPPTLELIGKPWHQVRGRTDAEFLDDPLEGKAVMANDRRVMAGSEPEVLEETVGMADGLSRIWLSTKAPMRDDEGGVIGLVGISQDISERKHAEERLLELNETLEARVAERTRERDRAWNNSLDLLVVLDEVGNLKTVNSAWTGILGWSTEEILDRSILDFIHPEDHSSSRGALTSAGSGPLPHFVNRYRHKDGSLRWISWTAVPEAGHIYACGRDITSEREVAAALAVKAEQLEASNRELESFSYSISHDLRAPLRAINGFGMMLLEDYGDRLDDEGRRLLSTIRENSRRMGVLIDELLTFSRLSHAPLSSQDMNVDTLVREVIDEVAMGYKGTRVDFDVGDLLPMRGDRGLLRQAWVNLVSNAVKYSSTRSRPRVEVRCRSEGAETVYSIRDNGVGFDMKYVDKLFGVFQRLHAAHEFSGTGVGLAIVHRIVTRHGGRVWAEGELDLGAAFSFAVPAAPAV